jgi:SAM-dependent methyltransferase
MHGSVLEWVGRLAPKLPKGGRVLEAGSLNVNGSVRPIIQAECRPCHYLGIDLLSGDGVDLLTPGGVESLPGEERFDLVVSTEMLEHAREWKRSFRAMVRLLAADGHLVLTARGPGYWRHNEPDYWRFSVDDMILASRATGLAVIECGPDLDPHSPGVFLWARKLALPDVMREPGWQGD